MPVVHVKEDLVTLVTGIEAIAAASGFDRNFDRTYKLAERMLKRCRRFTRLWLMITRSGSEARFSDEFPRLKRQRYDIVLRD
ncbi:MAG: hypothetical protein JJE51_12035 [Thermoanaerobaculia bacterium]|nr:hypothetical protein [Thermoanaerobaculia bacterium]